MLLQRLKEYADERLPDQAPPLYASTPVATIVRLHEDGRPYERAPLSNIDPDAKRASRGARGREMIAPEIRRASNLQPLLLCDNGAYTFGLADADDSQRAERAERAHKTYLALLDECADVTGEPSVRAVQRFYVRGGPAQIELQPDLDHRHKITFEVVFPDGTVERPIDLPSVREFWLSLHEPGAETIGQCLVCGERRPLLERLPSAIKGIPGGGSTGTALISANLDVFESYGLKASLNSPTCRECAEAFTRALNHLLADPDSRLFVGDTAFVFWSRPNARLPDLAGLLRGPGKQPAVDILSQLHQPEATTTDTALAEPFYAVALGAGLGRAVVRDWIDTTADRLESNIASWFAMQRIADPISPDAPRPIGIFALAASLVRDAQSEMPAELARGLFRTAVLGDRLPSGLAAQAAIRCRAEQRVTRPRAAMIRMALLAGLPDRKSNDDYLVALEPDHPAPAYHCGRLLSVLESVQRAATPGLKTTVTDRFWGSASTRPALAFATLLRGSRPHLERLRRDRRGLYYNRQNLIEAVLERIPEWPKTLTLDEQSLFALGYFHQQTSGRQRHATREESTGGRSEKTEQVRQEEPA